MATEQGSSHVWDCDRMLRQRCPWTWEGLDPGPRADVRHCRECNRDVHFCRTPADFVHHGEQGHCVAIPDDLSPRYGLGQPSPEEVLRRKALADQGVAWWEEVLRREPSLDAGQLEKIRDFRSHLLEHATYRPGYLAIIRMAVRDGGVVCPHCGSDIAEDDFGIMVFLAERICIDCQEPIELELPPE